MSCPNTAEGSIVMGYTVANGGGLPFSDTLHFELYAVGNAVAIYTVDKTYNLYPGAERERRLLWNFHWLPAPTSCAGQRAKAERGRPILQYCHRASASWRSRRRLKYPVGLTEMAYQITNSDTVAGSIPLLIEIVPAAGGAAIYVGKPQLLYQRRRKHQRHFQF